jgi:hypothetical protein
LLQKVAQKRKSYLKLLKPKKVAPNAKSSSKVAEHNRDMPSRASPLTSKIGYEYRVRSRNRATVLYEALFDWGAESEGQRPEEIFKFRVSEMPFPGLWGKFNRILMVRKQHFSMSKFTI